MTLYIAAIYRAHIVGSHNYIQSSQMGGADIKLCTDWVCADYNPADFILTK